jgi:membrane-bound inhibitor of C-type lysozyme
MDGRIKSGHDKYRHSCAILARMSGLVNRKILFVLGAALLVAPAATAAETFQTYLCADGSQFVAAFYPQDPRRAYLQIDGRAVALRQRVALSGSRYTGNGLTLKISKAGTSIQRGRRPAASCTAQ